MFRSPAASEFSVRLAELLGSDRRAVADFVVALVEFDGRRLWEELGYTSLFMYLHRELGLSKAAAYFRKTAADLVREYPGILEPLRDGRLCITSIVELAKVVTPENSPEVIPQFFNCSKAEAREVAAALAPVADPPRREVVTAISRLGVVRPDEPDSSLGTSVTPREQGSGSEMPCSATGFVPALATASAPTTHPRPSGSRPRDEIEPLSATLSRYHLTVTRQFLQKLEAARDALSHAKPDASTCDILEAGLNLLIAEHGRRKGLVKRPRATPRPSKSDAIPADVKRAVWTRDGGCCQWKLPSGEICGSRTRVQFDHVVPRARGGSSTVENLRLLCGPHNRLAARRILGNECVDRHLGRRRRPRRLEPPPEAEQAAVPTGRARDSPVD